MATSGTWTFNPSLGELGLYAFQLAQVRPTALLAEHMESLRMAANLLLGRWSSMPGVNTWLVDLQQVPLVAGQGAYNVPVNTIAMLDAYIIQNGGAAAVNRLLLPITRSEYASYPNPQMEGQPTVFWFDRLLTPTVTLWPVPDGNESYFNYYRIRQAQDAVLTNGTQVELPTYWFDAFAFGLAWRLALVWNQQAAAGLKVLADEAYNVAADQNTETGAFYISPGVQPYWRA